MHFKHQKITKFKNWNTFFCRRWFGKCDCTQMQDDYLAENIHCHFVIPRTTAFFMQLHIFLDVHQTYFGRIIVLHKNEITRITFSEINGQRLPTFLFILRHLKVVASCFCYRIWLFSWPLIGSLLTRSFVASSHSRWRVLEQRFYFTKIDWYILIENIFVFIMLSRINVQFIRMNLNPAIVPTCRRYYSKIHLFTCFSWFARELAKLIFITLG